MAAPLETPRRDRRELAPGERHTRSGHRCRGCGALLVVVPCRLCTLRAKLARSRPQ